MNKAIEKTKDRKSVRYDPHTGRQDQTPGVNTRMANGRGLDNVVVLTVQGCVLDDAQSDQCDMLGKWMRRHNNELLSDTQGSR